MKPGSCGPGVLGIYPVIYDENGDEVVEAGSGKAGNICIRNPWPGIFQTIWGQPERFVEIYYAKYCRNQDSKDWRDWPYFAGDGAVQAADGYFRILGRVDDVINVAGHRLGHQGARVGEPHRRGDRRGGRGPGDRRAARPGRRDVRRAQARVHRRARRSSRRSARRSTSEIGKIARPKNVWIVPDMPKTRSGKIMRRVIAAHLQLRRRRRRHDAGEPRDRRRHPPPRAEREARPRRDPARALRERERGDRSVRPRRVDSATPVNPLSPIEQDRARYSCSRRALSRNSPSAAALLA